MNKWVREEANEDGSYEHVEVPDGVPAPRCATCGEGCRDLSMSMIGWARPESFDGFHFFHKGDCDPGKRVWPSTLEVAHYIESTQALLGFIYYAMGWVERAAPLTDEVRESIGDAVGWLTLLATQSIGDAFPLDDGGAEFTMASLLGEWRERQWYGPPPPEQDDRP